MSMMGSRVRQNVVHLFECFFEIAPASAEGTQDSWILQQFPDKYNDQQILKVVPKFVYPCKVETTVIQHFSFVLTNNESKWTFGFCRHDPKTDTAIAVLSHLPWHHVFYKFLDTSATVMNSTRAEDLREFLTSVYNAKIADPGKLLTAPFNKGQSLFSVDIPHPFQLPSIPENRNLTEYYNAVDSNNMMVIFASMLYERRIIIKSSKLNRLSACVQSANDIIYPMIWQHIFLPVLPMALIEYLSAPMPFLIGVPEEVMKKVNRHEIGDVVILDADNNSIETPFDDVNSLPQEVMNPLRRQLKNKSDLLGDGVSRAFLRALVQLIGGYRDALKFQPGKNVMFDEEKFVNTRPTSFKPFIRDMLNLQIFQQFIEDRLIMLNNGLGFSDEFEMETFKLSERSSSKLKQQYKEWTATMKKEGSAFFKSVKDKANPAMKTAVRTVKDGGKGVKSAYRGLRSRLKENQRPQQLENGLDSPNDKPRSAPNSPTNRRRLAGFSMPAVTYRKEGMAFKGSAFERTYTPLSPGSQPISPEEGYSRGTSPSLDIPRIDLMNEMEDLLQLRLGSPPVDRSLKSVRSLENFKQLTSASSPDHWALPNRANPASPSRFFVPLQHSQETQNLLQSPDDVFSSPPVPPRVVPPDIFGTAPFVVAGGHNENGDSLFYVANRNSVDIVKLSPPVSSPRRKQNANEDLIRLDSTTSDDIDDFDPLKNKTYYRKNQEVPMSISNPLYTYENYTPKQNGSVSHSKSPRTIETSKNDQDLLQEYGLDFKNFSNVQNHRLKFESLSNGSSASSHNKWTTFD